MGRIVTTHPGPDGVARVATIRTAKGLCKRSFSKICVLPVDTNNSLDDMKREWKKLQDCYRQAMLRRKTKSGQSATKTKPWKYEELMSFLASDTLPRSTQSNVLDPDDENTENVEPIESNDDTQGQHEEEENALEDDQSNSALNSQGPRYNKSLKSNRTNVQKADDGVQRAITFLSKKESNKNKNGELDYFFASACESTKNLPRYLQLRVKQQIMDAIIKAESEYLNTRPQSSVTFTSGSVAVQTSMVSPHSDRSEQPMMSPPSDPSQQNTLPTVKRDGTTHEATQDVCMDNHLIFLKPHVIRMRLTYEEMYTLLTQIEALLNSRPLTPLGSDPNDLSALTPGHFLVLEPLGSALPDIRPSKLSLLSRWQLLQKMIADFWKRWSNEYCHTLQQRSKWLKNSTNVSIGSLVLIKSENHPPLQWTLARIVKLHPGSDGVVRVVTLQTAQGTLQCPVVKICPLPTNDSPI
nr:unnamed protein product [Callosobruchus analis]